MYDQQDVDPKKVRPIQMGECMRKHVPRRLLALSEEILQPSRHRCGRSERVPQVAPGYWPSFTSCSTMNG